MGTFPSVNDTTGWQGMNVSLTLVNLELHFLVEELLDVKGKYVCACFNTEPI